MEQHQTSTTSADEPIGSPPAGGSWRWEGGAWVRNDVPQTLPRAAQPATPVDQE